MTAPRADAQRRALSLFEQFVDGCAPADRERLLAQESEDVQELLQNLEAAASRARRNFPTEEDARLDRAPMPLPDRIGAYRLTAVLGAGGMGLVFRGERDDALFEHAVAIKLIHPDRFSSAAQARFESERRLLARLEHPAIARLIDGGVDPLGWPYLIMELVDGASLDRWLEHNRPAPAEAAELVIAVAEAVQAAHNALVIHGDLKPSNVMMAKDGRVRLLDFGVGRFADADPINALEPRTERYASPQRRAGCAPTVSDDLYALGRVLHELLPAKRDPDLAAIVARATQDEPNDRYAGVGALRDDLKRWQSKRPVEARPLTPAYQIERLIARRRWFVSLTGAATALLIGISVFATTGWQAAKIRQRDAEAHLAEARELARLQLDAADDTDPAHSTSIVARAANARRMQALLDRLAHSVPTDPAVRHDLAEGLWRLAALQASDGQPSLGDANSARRNLDEALRVLTSQHRVVDQNLRALVLMDLAQLAMARSQDLAAAKLSLDGAERALRGGADWRAQALLGILRADLADWGGDYAAGQAAARRALGLLPVGDATWPTLSLRARALGSLGEAVWDAGHATEAEPIYRSQIALLSQASAAAPGNRALRWQLAEAEWNLGTTLTSLGRAAAALAPLSKAQFAMAAEAGADPNDEEAQRRYSVTTLAYGQALAASNRFNEGQVLLNQALNQRRARLLQRPSEPGRARDFAIAAATLGDAFIAQGRVAKACSVYQQADQTFLGLAEKRQLVSLDQSHDRKRVSDAMVAHCRTASQN